MVTLSQAPSNRLCHSPSSVRVKGDPTSRYDVGDPFITGCAPHLSQLLKQRSHFSTGHLCHQFPTSFVPATRLCCGISKFRRASNYYCWDVICVWQSCQLVIGSSCVSLFACPFLPPLYHPLRLWNRSSRTFPASLILMCVGRGGWGQKGKRCKGLPLQTTASRLPISSTAVDKQSHTGLVEAVIGKHKRDGNGSDEVTAGANWCWQTTIRWVIAAWHQLSATQVF